LLHLREVSELHPWQRAAKGSAMVVGLVAELLGVTSR